jgi:ketosteroid isomerase-like protein
MDPSGKPSDVPETVLTAMRQTNDLFNMEVVMKGNLNALDRVCTSGARILPPGAPMVEGREQIKAFWNQAINGMKVTGAKLTIMNAERVGNDVIEIGRADLSVARGGVVTVKYVVHWKQEEGAWKWHVDIWNLSE